ncbi:MAG: hypothetical protein RQ936_10035 [Gammaproteobacteria bacterium]|nr:hypothetical protein [Gammaproteobacteria bacterium]
MFRIKMMRRNIKNIKTGFGRAGLMLMLSDTPFNQCENLLPLRISWIQKLPGLTLLLLVVLCFPWTQANGAQWAQANGLFDFQMKLATKGNVEAEFKVGEMYEAGFGVEKDIKAAREWINKAAAQGHEAANFKLLYWEIESNGVEGENKKKLAELKSKADKGNPQAMYYLGKMHAYGVGVKTNYDLALDWLNKATFLGVLEAERESLVVRNMKQKALEKSRQAEMRKLAMEKSQQEDLRRKVEAQRKAEEAEAQRKAEAAKAQLKAGEPEAQPKVEEAEQLQADARRKLLEAQEQAYLKKISDDSLNKPAIE